MAGRAVTPQGRNINNMPNRRYLPSINFSVPFARWSHFYVSIDWTKRLIRIGVHFIKYDIQGRIFQMCRNLTYEVVGQRRRLKAKKKTYLKN
jgi:hypothetical protein